MYENEKPSAAECESCTRTVYAVNVLHEYYIVNFSKELRDFIKPLCWKIVVADLSCKMCFK